MVLSGVAVPHVVMSHVVMRDMAHVRLSVLPMTPMLTQMLIHLIAVRHRESCGCVNALGCRPLQPMAVKIQVGAKPI